MADLFEGCSDEEVMLKTDNTYAKRYDEWRRKEELMKAKARFGSDLDDSSSSDEEEDDGASRWTSEHEKKFLTTLSVIKARDPKIYNKDEIIFPEVLTTPPEVVEKSPVAAKMTLRDYEREIITTEGGRYVDEDDEQLRKNVFEETQQDRLAYDAEQRELRESLKKAAWEDKVDSDADDQEGGEILLAKKKPKTDDERAQDDEDYVRWLKGETKKLSNKKDAKDLATLKQLWSSEGEGKLDDAEKFLRDYVLNRRYLTANEDDYRFEVDFSEDEKDIAAMTEFEHKYNFRFEDPDPDFIKRYPRTIEDSMRRKDTRRVDKKAEKKARKELLKVQMKEEVNRLKSFKKKEILEKIEKLKSIAGSEEIAFDDSDIEGDFDPAEHDKRMAALFSAYDDEAGEEDYPEIDEDEHEDLRWENWDNYETENAKAQREAVEARTPETPRQKALGGNESSEESEKGSESNESDADGSGAESGQSAEPMREAKDIAQEDCGSGTHGSGIERDDTGKLLIRGKKSAKLVLEDVLPAKNERKRKKSKFAEAISKEKPSFDPEKDKTFEKYFDEYYKLDFEDVVAGLPTRFKYRQVVPNDFGLSAEEVLQSKDKELNKWCSLKKMVQYRSKDEEDKDLKLFGKRRDHLHLKKKILTSAYAAEEEKLDEEISIAAGRNPEEPVKRSKSRKNKKKRTVEQPFADVKESNDQVEAADDTRDVVRPPKKRRSDLVSETNEKKKRKLKTQAAEDSPVENDVYCGEDTGNPCAERKRSKLAHQEHAVKSPTTGENTEIIPQDRLTPKQKKNRRNAMIKKRKKLELRQKRVESKKLKKLKFKPLEDLKISDARIKAYGLNPNRVKGNLVYGERKNEKQSS